MFAAFVHFDSHSGCRAIIQEVNEPKEFEGVKIVTPAGGGHPRLLHSFEHCFETRQEAADWAAGEIEGYAQRCMDQAAAIRGDVIASGRGACV